MRALAAALALVLVATPALAGVKAGPNVIGRHHRLGPGGGGVLAGAGLDFNFMTGQYFQSGATPGVTVARASSKSCDDQAGNWTTVGNNVLCATNKGALIEEARTNGIRNNSGAGAVLGTPGTIPTNWFESHNTGIVPNVIGTGTEGGIDYVDFQFLGTATAGNNNLYWEGANTLIAATNAQAWAQSVFLRVVGGTLANINNITLIISQNNAGGSSVGNLPITISLPTSASLGSQRFSNLVTTNQATTAFVTPFMQINPNAGPINLTLRIGWPQLEQATFATSPIRTTSTAATRAADVVNVTTPPAFGSAYTLFAQGTPNAPVSYGNNQNILQSDAGGDGNRLVQRRNVGGAGAPLTNLVGGTGAGFSPAGSWAQSVSGKLISAVAASDQASVFNGGTPGTASAAVLPTTPTVVHLGSNAGPTEQWDGYLERIALWPTSRLPNATLQSLTQ